MYFCNRSLTFGFVIIMRQLMMTYGAMMSGSRKAVVSAALLSFAASCVATVTVEPTTDLHDNEVCQMETFHASCLDDEVVVVESAQLGRLKIGRCVQQVSEHYPIGCTLNVMAEMESYCSGRRRCRVKIDDHAFPRSTPCNQELKVHLWVKYRCRKVITPETSCSRSGFSYVVNEPTGGLLASQTTEDSGCGLTETPWIIQVGTGQRINVTMYDYSYSIAILQRSNLSPQSSGSRHVEVQEPPSQARTCRVFATIREPSRGSTTTTVCDMRGRVVNVFASDADRIELRIMTVTRQPAVGAASVPDSGDNNHQPSAPSGHIASPDNYIMFHYTVVGCADPAIASDGRTWKRRVADTMTIGCTGSDVSWKLICVDSQWQGTYSNCTDANVPVIGESTAYPIAISSIVVIIIAVFVSSVILLIGIMCIKWRLKMDPAGRRRLHQSELDQYQTSALYGLGPVGKVSTDVSYTAESIGPDSVAGIRNEYARMRLQRLAAGAGQQYRGAGGFDGVPYGLACRGGRLPPPLLHGVVEHVYESPDVVRRDTAFQEGQYTPTTAATVGPGPAGQNSHSHHHQHHHHQQPQSPNHGYWPLPASLHPDPESPGASPPHAQCCVLTPKSNVKAKNTGNYSL